MRKHEQHRPRKETNMEGRGGREAGEAVKILLCGITPVVGFSNASGRAIYLGQGIITVTDSKWVYFLNNISPQLDCQPEENCVCVCVCASMCVLLIFVFLKILSC